MTIDEFFVALKTAVIKPGYTTYARRGGALRIKSPDGEDDCPLTLVCLDVTGVRYIPHACWEDAANDLSISSEDADDIVESADAAYGKYRSTLLSILGLEEEE